jgi:uncharacterized protein
MASSQHGKFVWYELMTSDSAAAQSFYAGVLGWQMRDAGMPGMSYTLFSVGEQSVGGIMDLPPEACAAGAPPCWTGYVGVDDVDAYAQRVSQAGGALHREPQDIPGVGRFAVVADPQGGVIVLFKDNQSEAPPAAPAGTPGHVGWHELYANDWPAALAFYGDLFGWTPGMAVDMGPMGTYQLFATTPGGDAVGGMMNRPAEVPVPCWLYYFNVEAVDAAVLRVTTNGGQVVNGPHQVPGGSWIVQCLDPQGAMFALVAPGR